MSYTVVVSQPMYFPWIGLFEQVRLSDVFVHYDDVQLPKGRHFMSRVQIKSPNGVLWLSAVLDRLKSGNQINETMLVDYSDWRQQHLKKLKHCYARAPFFNLMYDIANIIYQNQTTNLSEFNCYAIEYISEWLGFTTKFIRSSELGIPGSSTDRLVEICKYFKADTYVTGLGALNYLNYDLFESNGVSVRYMDYKKTAYKQLWGEFTPYVSILDAIANCGNDVLKIINSESIYWRDYNDKQS